MSRVRLDVQDGDWEKKLQEEKRRWGRLQAEMWVWPLCRSEARKEGQAVVGSGLGTVLGEFFVRADGKHWSQGHHRGHPTSCRDGPTFISFLVGWRIHGAQGGLSTAGRCQSVSHGPGSRRPQGMTMLKAVAASGCPDL